MNAFKTFIGKMGARVSQGAPNPPNVSSGPVFLLMALGGGTYTAYKAAMTVQPGHVGLVYNRYGGLDEKKVLTEGLNFVVPWFQRAVVYDVRTRARLMETNSGSKDLQMVQIQLRILFKPDRRYLPFIHRRLGTDFDARVLPSIVTEVTKAVVAQYNASELLTKREFVSNKIRSLLTKRAEDFHILLDDVALVHLAFSKEYTNAVEAKQVAQQDAERAKYIVERAIQEKKSIVVRAEGEAESARLIGNAIKNNPSFVQLRKIEATKEIANTIASSGNKIYLDADALMINNLAEKKHKENTQQGWLW